MDPLFCILLVFSAGALGGIANALLSGNGFPLPRLQNGVWCPGALSTVAVGAISALSSWALYGSGAGIDLARLGERGTISLQLSTVVGALLVGASGARWLTNEVDKKLLKEGVRLAARKNLTPEQCEAIMQAPPREILEAIAKA
ncbi:MAG: hypothetical protein ABI779_25065 [Acidobacteriota bacterium]